MRARGAAVGSDPTAVTAANEHLADGGGALDAVLAGFFAAAGKDPGVLLGPLSVLVAGVGQGARAFDGRMRQPGLTAKRPRGFTSDEAIPDAARVAAPTSIAAAIVAHAYGSASLRTIVRPGIVAAERANAARRAELLERVSRVGASAVLESAYRRGLLRVASASEGGLITPRDLDPPSDIDVPAGELVAEDRRFSVVPWATPDRPQLLPNDGGRGEAVGAIDVHGMLAAVAYRVAPAGIWVDDLELYAPLSAVPVKRGVPRTTPGTRLPTPAPMAIRWEAQGAVELLLEPASAVLDPSLTNSSGRFVLRRDPASRLVETRRS